MKLSYSLFSKKYSLVYWSTYTN